MLQRARGLHFIRRGNVVGRNVVSLLVSRPSKVAVKARQHVSCSLVSFDGKWFIATCSCVSQQLSCLVALLEFTHSFLDSSGRVVRIANDFALWCKV